MYYARKKSIYKRDLSVKLVPWVNFSNKILFFKTKIKKKRSLSIQMNTIQNFYDINHFPGDYDVSYCADAAVNGFNPYIKFIIDNIKKRG